MSNDLDLSRYEGHTPGPWEWRNNLPSNATKEDLATKALMADAPLLLAEVKRLRAELVQARDALTAAYWAGVIVTPPSHEHEERGPDYPATLWMPLPGTPEGCPMAEEAAQFLAAPARELTDGDLPEGYGVSGVASAFMFCRCGVWSMMYPTRSAAIAAAIHPEKVWKGEDRG